MKEKEIQSVSFHFENKEYQIKTCWNEDSLNIKTRAFLDGKPASFPYSVDSITKADIKSFHGINIIDEFVEDAKEDIREKRWEAFINPHK